MCNYGPRGPKICFSHLSNIFSEKKFDFLTPPWPFFGATKILDTSLLIIIEGLLSKAILKENQAGQFDYDGNVIR